MTGAVRISLAGSGALLLDGSDGDFDDSVQRRVWALARDAMDVEGVQETAPGMNNLLVLFDPLATSARDLGQRLAVLWDGAEASAVVGAHYDIPVTYGGALGEDLGEWAAHCGLSLEETVGRHAAATYTVAAVGAMPGFPYLSGLAPELAWARRSMPRLRVAEGAVIIGAAQAGVMPMTAPSGWHVIGHTNLKLFDADRESPVLLHAGDTVRFVIEGIKS